MTFAINVSLAQEAFRPGEMIRGELLISTPFSFDISGIHAQLQGFERVRFRQRAGSANSNSNSNSSDSEIDWEARNGKTVNTAIPTILPISQPHFSQSILIYSSVPIANHRERLQIGSHSFPFTIVLPDKLPPSLNFSSGSKYSAEIEYSLHFQVFPSSPKAKTNAILMHTAQVKVLHLQRRHVRFKKVLSFLDQKISIAHAFCFCLPEKELNFFADWKRNTFHSGQVVELVLRLSLAFGSGTCKLKHVSVKLVRDLVLSVNSQIFRTVNPVSKARFGVEGALLIDQTGFELCTSTAALQVPANLEPTTSTSSISCRYFFVFEVHFNRFQTVLLSSEVIIQ